MNHLAPALLDETSEPSLRSTLGALLARASAADFAIRRIRLARIDLSAAELGPLQACRVLVGRLDAGSLHDLPAHNPQLLLALHRLLRFATSGRLAVRVAPTSGWNPDFSIFRQPLATEPASTAATCLVGSHYFHEPDPPEGPAFTGVFDEPAAVRLTQQRFDRLWDAGYDVLPAVCDAIHSLVDTRP